MKRFLFILTLSSSTLFAQEQEPPKQPPKQEATKAVELEWDYDDITVIKGFRLYYGTVAGTYEHHVDIVKETDGSLKLDTEVKDLVANTKYFFVVTAFDETMESTPSNEVEWLSPKNLSKPFNLRTKIAMNADGKKSIVFNIEGGPANSKAKLLASFDLEEWQELTTIDLNDDGEAELEAVMSDAGRMFFKAEI